MIHIADTKVARRYGDFFIRQIHKFEEVSSDTSDLRQEKVLDLPVSVAGPITAFFLNTSCVRD